MSSNTDENCKDVLNRFNEIKDKFDLNSKNWRKKQNISVNLLFDKPYNLLRNQLRKYMKFKIIFLLN